MTIWMKVGWIKCDKTYDLWAPTRNGKLNLKTLYTDVTSNIEYIFLLFEFGEI